MPTGESESPKPIPDRVRQRLTEILSFYDSLPEIGQKFSQADGGNLFPQDLVGTAVVNRSLANVHGFVSMVESRNPLIAGAILRLQLDSIMRFAAFNYVANAQDVLSNLLEGAPFKRLKSTSNKPLSDQFLHEELSKYFPWVSSVYKATSGFVHLSKPHMFAHIVSLQEPDRLVKMCISPPPIDHWRDEDMIEAVDAFHQALLTTEMLLGAWCTRKTKAAEERDKKGNANLEFAGVVSCYFSDCVRL